MRLQHEYDTHAAGEPIPGWRGRTKIVEIVACHDLLFTLAHSGVCTAYNRGESPLAAPTSYCWLGFPVSATPPSQHTRNSVAVGRAPTPRDGS